MANTRNVSDENVIEDKKEVGLSAIYASTPSKKPEHDNFHILEYNFTYKLAKDSNSILASSTVSPLGTGE